MLALLRHKSSQRRCQLITRMTTFFQKYPTNKMLCEITQMTLYKKGESQLSCRQLLDRNVSGRIISGVFKVWSEVKHTNCHSFKSLTRQPATWILRTIDSKKRCHAIKTKTFNPALAGFARPSAQCGTYSCHDLHVRHGESGRRAENFSGKPAMGLGDIDHNGLWTR